VFTGEGLLNGIHRAELAALDDGNGRHQYVLRSTLRPVGDGASKAYTQEGEREKREQRPPAPFSNMSERCAFCTEPLGSVYYNAIGTLYHIDCHAQLERRKAAEEAEPERRWCIWGCGVELFGRFYERCDDRHAAYRGVCGECELKKKLGRVSSKTAYSPMPPPPPPDPEPVRVWDCEDADYVIGGA
jgi:hypothetical protein